MTDADFCRTGFLHVSEITSDTMIAQQMSVCFVFTLTRLAAEKAKRFWQMQ